MDADEMQYLQKMHDAESKEYIYGLKLIARFAIVLPLVVGLLSYFYLPRLTYMLQVYGWSQIITAVILLLYGLGNYFRSLYSLKLDLKYGEKTIETVRIQRKKYMPSNQTYHFYIDSDVKYSIEVSAEDFEKYNIGDELNIEYGRYSHVYFTYY